MCRTLRPAALNALFHATLPRHTVPMIDPPPLPPASWPRIEPGWVWLCGAGPGDPGLLTLHALNALRQADVIVYDALLDRRNLDWRAQGTETVFAGKRGGKPSALQRDISQMTQARGEAVTFAEAQALGLDRAILQALLAQAALEESARRAGLSVGDETVSEQILALPNFIGADGTFDREAYQYAL